MSIDSALFQSNRHDWQTPPELFEPLHAEFGFTLDAAASAENALLPRYWTAEDDALTQDWTGERVYCNPPYGRSGHRFIRKAAERRAAVAVLLVPARPDTAAWHECVLGVAEIRFIRGRVRFVGAQHGAPFPSAILVYREELRAADEAERRFYEEIAQAGIPAAQEKE